MRDEADERQAAGGRGVIPAELVGVWMRRNPGIGSPGLRLTAEGLHHVALLAWPYALSPDGRELTLEGGRYTRLTTEPRGLGGLWQSVDDPGHHWFFQGDTAFEMEVSGLAYRHWVVEDRQASPPTLQLWPLRSMAVASATTITFFPVYERTVDTVRYALAGDVLTLHLPNGTTAVYDRAP